MLSSEDAAHMNLSYECVYCTLKAHSQGSCRAADETHSTTINCDSEQGRLGQPLLVCSDCVSVCSPSSSCGALCCGAKSHCWEPQWKRSIVHIPAT